MQSGDGSGLTVCSSDRSDMLQTLLWLILSSAELWLNIDPLLNQLSVVHSAHKPKELPSCLSSLRALCDCDDLIQVCSSDSDRCENARINGPEPVRSKD